MLCSICHRPLHQTAVPGLQIGPTCARKRDLLPTATRRSRVITPTSQDLDPNQVDWINRINSGNAGESANSMSKETPTEFAFSEVCDNSEKPHLRILMGHGRIEVGHAIHEGLPALWFGNDGQGLGFERDRNERSKPDETLVVITFENLQGLEAIEFAVARVRKAMEAAAGVAA